MDPETIVQDVQRCKICNKGIAELFCIYCEIRLCTRCTGDHLAEDPEKHKIVKHHEKYTTLILPTCAIHSEERCKTYCQQCDIVVCSSCVSSQSHERHKFLEIVDVFNKNTEIIKNDTAELELEILPSYEEIVKQAELNEIESEKEFEAVLVSIEEQGRKWHQEIDIIVNALKNDVGCMRKTQIIAFNEHLQRLKNVLSDVKQSICLNKDLLESLEISQLLSYESKNSKLKRLPPKLEISVPRFLPKGIENELNSQKFGVITGLQISNHDGSYQLKSQSDPVSRSNDKENKKQSKRVLNEPTIVVCLRTYIKGPKNIACTNDGNLLISGEEGQLQLFRGCFRSTCHQVFQEFFYDPLFSILKNVPVQKGIKDIAVTKTGDIVFGRILSNKISIFRDEETKELIYLNAWSLLSLCTTINDGLLVCMIDAKSFSCRVVRFEGFKERQIIQYNNEGKNLYTAGKEKKYVKENCNGDVCVAECDGKGVVVTDKAGAFRFRYFRGHNPLGIATDSQAQLIVPYPDQVHIIDMNGNFLHNCNIYQSCTAEVRLAIDKKDNLYLFKSDGTVNKIRYMTPRRRKIPLKSLDLQIRSQVP